MDNLILQRKALKVYVKCFMKNKISLCEKIKQKYALDQQSCYMILMEK